MRQSSRIVVAIGLLALGLTACTKKLDTSSPEAVRTSLERMRASLPPEKLTKFNEAILVLSSNKLLGGGTQGFDGVLAMAGKDPNQLIAETLKDLHGKTADEIIAAADMIVVERKAKERAQALTEIKELEEAQAAAAKAKVALAKFEVIKSRFYQRQSSFMKQPIIELTVKNGTDQPIARAFFVGTIASPGRAVPWLREDFNYPIAGGIEPGETASWSLAPNMFSKWSVDAPRDAVFTVEVVRLDGPGDKTLFDSDFSEEKVKRLAALKAQYP